MLKKWASATGAEIFSQASTARLTLRSPRLPRLSQNLQGCYVKLGRRRPRKPRRKADEEPRDILSRRYVCEVCVTVGKKKFSRPSELSCPILLHVRTHHTAPLTTSLTCLTLFTVRASNETLRRELLNLRNAVRDSSSKVSCPGNAVPQRLPVITSTPDPTEQRNAQIGRAHV